MRLTGRWTKGCHTENFLGYSFQIKGKVAGGDHFVPHFGVDTMLPPPATPPGWQRSFLVPAWSSQDCHDTMEILFQVSVQWGSLLWNVTFQGFPGRSSWESTCQFGGHGFDPWSGKIPHASELLSRVPQILKPTHLEPTLLKRSHCDDKPTHRGEEPPPLTAARESPGASRKAQHRQI